MKKCTLRELCYICRVKKHLKKSLYYKTISFFKYFKNSVAYFTYIPDICKLFNKRDLKIIVMSRICDLTGKASIVGNNVSNSNRKTKRRFHPNLKLKKFYIPEEDKWITLKVSTSAVKTISKNGITACINKFVKKGYI